MLIKDIAVCDLVTNISPVGFLSAVAANTVGIVFTIKHDYDIFVMFEQGENGLTEPILCHAICLSPFQAAA